MSRPAGMAQISPHVTRTGIVIAVSPTSDPTHQIQLERTNGSSTGTFTQVAMLAGQVGPGQYPTYIDVLPNDGITRVYRAKAYKQGYTQSTSYTPLLKAKPAIIPEGVTVQTPITGHKIGSNVSLSTAAKLQYGSAAVQSSGVRMTFYPSALWVPASTAVHYIRTAADGALQVPDGLLGTGTTALQWTGALVLPAKATIQKLTVAYKVVTPQKMQFRFDAIRNPPSTAASGGLLWNKSSPSSGTNVVSSSSFGPLKSSGYDYIRATLAMRSTAATGSPGFYGVTVTYTVPSYDKTI